MKIESSLVEEAHVKNLRLFKCPNFKEEVNGLILFRIYNTEYFGQPGTQSEAIRGWEPKHIGFSFGPYFFRCLYDDLPLDEDDDDVFKTVKNTNCFGFEATRVLTQEISGYMRSCYGLYEDTLFGLTHDSELKNDFLMVVVVDVCVRSSTVGYLEAKLTLVNGKNRFSQHDDQDAARTSCDGHPNIDDMVSTRAHDDDLNKASGGSSDVDHMDDVEDYDDYDGDDDVGGGEDDDIHKAVVSSEESKYVHVDGNDDGDVGMQEEDDGGLLDYYTFDEHGEDCLYDIIECVKQWKQVENEDEEPIVMLEERPLLTIEEMELEWMEDGNYKPLIGTVNTNLVDVDDCSICISGFTENVPKSSTFPWCPKMNSSRIVRLGCGHVFHYQCVLKWLSKTPSCPLCRSSSLVYV